MSAESKIAGWDELVSVYYRLDVINYCSLSSPQVVAGFKKVSNRLMDKHGFSDEQLNIIQGEALDAGYREWTNRSLGGFRGWCKNEGREYAREFSELTE